MESLEDPTDEFEGSHCAVIELPTEMSHQTLSHVLIRLHERGMRSPSGFIHKVVCEENALRVYFTGVSTQLISLWGEIATSLGLPQPATI